MKTLYEQLQGLGIDVPEDKRADFEKSFRGAYRNATELESVNTKHAAELERLNTDYAAAQEALGKANETIAGFGDVEALNARITEYETKYKEAVEAHKAKAVETEAAYQKRIAEMEFDRALSEKLPESMFSSKAARKAVIADIKAKEMKLENGSIIGLDDVIKQIKEHDPDSFASNDPPPPILPPGPGRRPAPAQTEIEALRAAYEKARQLRNTTELSRLIRLAQQKGISLF